MTDQPTEQNSPIHNLLKDTQPLTPSINRRRFYNLPRLRLSQVHR